MERTERRSDRRLDRWTELLGAEQAVALVVLADSAAEPDIAPFVGDVHLGHSFLIATAAGDLRLGYLTEMERDEAARTGLPLAGPAELELESLRALDLSAGAFLADAVARAAALDDLGPGRLLVAGRTAAGDLLDLFRRLTESGWELASGAEVGRLLRKSKGPDHLAEIRRVADVVCGAFRRVASILASAEMKPGGLHFEGAVVTAGRLRGEIANHFADSGLDQPQGNIVALGADAGVPHTAGDDERVIEVGESLVVDLYPRGWLFADCTRTFCVGQPSEELDRAHALVVETLRDAHRTVRAGGTGWALQEGACERLGRGGYATPLTAPGATSGYVHNLGHGVGFALHEYPSFRSEAGDAGVFAVGDVFTLEPGLYDPERGFGVRVEDTVVLTERGAENLTPIPYALDPAAW